MKTENEVAREFINDLKLLLAKYNHASIQNAIVHIRQFYDYRDEQVLPEMSIYIAQLDDKNESFVAARSRESAPHSKHW